MRFLVWLLMTLSVSVYAANDGLDFNFDEPVQDQGAQAPSFDAPDMPPVSYQEEPQAPAEAPIVEPLPEPVMPVSEQLPVELPPAEEAVSEEAQKVAPPATTEVSVAELPGASVAVKESKEAPTVQPAETAVTPTTPQETKEPVKEPAQQPAPQEEKLEGISIDTIGLTDGSGNWLEKRIWWQRAQERLTHLKDRVTQIMQARMPFVNKKNELEETVIVPFELEAGISQGELSVILSHLINEIEQLRKKEGALTKQEADFLEMISAQQKVLEQLHLDVQAIAKLDRALEDALTTLLEQSNKARGYEDKAAEHVQTIAKELSEKKARELYYAVEALDKSAGDILKYIQNEFTVSFDTLIKTVKEQVERIKNEVRGLKEKGIDFKQQADLMEKQAQERNKGRLEHEKQEAIERAVQEAKEGLSWSALPGRVWRATCSGITSAACCVGDFFGSAYSTVAGWFGSSAQEADEQKNIPAKQPQASPE